MGNSEFGLPVLGSLAHNANYSLVAVVTNPQKQMGRGRSYSETTVGAAARELGLNLIQPLSLKDPGFIATLKDLNPDLFVVVAYRILPGEVLSIPALGSINLHASLLPEYRGAAPIQRALMDGKKVTGITTFLIEPKVDTGAILMKKSIQIEDSTNYGQLSEIMSKAGPEIVLNSIKGLIEKTITPIPQDQVFATPAPKIRSEDKLINWEKPATDIHNQVRALSPTPGAYTSLGKRRFKIFKTVCLNEAPGLAPGELFLEKGKLVVGTGKGRLALLEIQREGGKKMETSEFLKGFQINQGARFAIQG